MTDRMRYGEKSFQEVNILEEVCICAGVRGAAIGSKADTETGGGWTEGAFEPGDLVAGGGDGSSSSRQPDNLAMRSSLDSDAAAPVGEHDDAGRRIFQLYQRV